MKITWHGHACFELDGSKNVLIDPFITGNPVAKVKPQDLNPDILLITHGHEDHIGDAVEIAKRSRPKIAVIHEIAVFLQNNGIDADGMNFYGSVEYEGVRVTLVPAVHSSSYSGKYMGSAGGYIVEMDGVVVYHAGDTGIFSDMALIGEIFKPKVMLIPVGDRYTMSPEIAAKAVELVKPEVAIPMHYGTFPVLLESADKFKELVPQAVLLKPGENYEVR